MKLSTQYIRNQNLEKEEWDDTVFLSTTIHWHFLDFTFISDCCSGSENFWTNIFPNIFDNKGVTEVLLDERGEENEVVIGDDFFFPEADGPHKIEEKGRKKRSSDKLEEP